mmetsp:Transcript_30009/g.91341  ORF Transcript_30009/g.91341 Transcript_30009/m.91341 type:complete len:276 (+) Transcript_30009:279-1106(+)
MPNRPPRVQHDRLLRRRVRGDDGAHLPAGCVSHDPALTGHRRDAPRLSLRQSRLEVLGPEPALARPAPVEGEPASGLAPDVEAGRLHTEAEHDGAADVDVLLRLVRRRLPGDRLAAPALDDAVARTGRGLHRERASLPEGPHRGWSPPCRLLDDRGARRELRRRREVKVEADRPRRRDGDCLRRREGGAVREEVVPCRGVARAPALSWVRPLRHLEPGRQRSVPALGGVVAQPEELGGAAQQGRASKGKRHVDEAASGREAASAAVCGGGGGGRG